MFPLCETDNYNYCNQHCIIGLGYKYLLRSHITECSEMTERRMYSEYITTKIVLETKLFYYVKMISLSINQHHNLHSIATPLCY